MIGAVIAASVLAGFLVGWAIVPIVAALGLLVGLTIPRYAVVTALAVAAAITGVARSADSRQNELDPSWITTAEVTGQITSAAIDDGRTNRFIVETDDGHTLCARAFSRVDFGRGDRLQMTIDADDGENISSGFASYLRAHDCDWSGSLTRVTVLKSGTGIRRLLDEIREGAALRLVHWVPGDEGALLSGLVIGDDSLLSDKTMDAFKTTGTLHVVAISGSNLTLLVSLLLIGSFLSPRRGVTDLFALLALWAYVLVGGASPPTLRAGFLATAAAGARTLGRPADLLTLSLQVAAVQALIWPSSVTGLSYQLSTVAIFGVLVASNGRSFVGVVGAVKLVLLTTLVVNLLLLPILPAESRPALVLSLVANTLVAPLISLAFLLGLMALLLGLVHPMIGEPFALIAGEVNAVTIHIVQSVADWSWLPDSFKWDASNIQARVLLVAAIVVLLFASTEFRRGMGDLRRRIHHVDEATGMLWLGSGVGACLGVLAVAVIR